MRKEYIKPSMKVKNIETEEILAASVQAPDIQSDPGEPDVNGGNDNIVNPSTGQLGKFDVWADEEE